MQTNKYIYRNNLYSPKKNRFSLNALIKLCILALFIITFRIESSLHIYQDIAQENLKSLISLFSPSTNSELEWHEAYIEEFKQQLNPTPEAKRKMVFSLLHEYEKNHSINHEVLDKKSWKALELINGPQSDKQAYLAAQVDRTSLEIGKAILYKKIVCPLDNYQDLYNQQIILKELISNQEIYKQIDSILKQLVNSENALLSSWNDRDIFKEQMDAWIFKLPGEKKYATLKKISEKFNQNEFYTGINSQVSLLSTAFNFALMSLGTVVLPLKSIFSIANHPFSKQIDNFSDNLELENTSNTSNLGIILRTLKPLIKNKMFHTFLNIASASQAADSAYNYYYWLKIDLSIRKYIHTKISRIATFVKSFDLLSKTIEKSKLSHLLPLTKIAQEFTQLSKSKTEIEKLLTFLKSDTLKNNFSLLSHMGKIISAYKLFNKYKSYFLDAFVTIGELDAYMSTIRLYKEFENQPIKFCFPDYILTKNNTPVLKLESFWNPNVKSTHIVPNSLSIGADDSEETQKSAQSTLIVTGPNAGGKSSITKALIYNALLAQSIGLAAAEKCSLTPFYKIGAYLNITEDSACQLSLFEMAAQRSHDMLSLVNTLPQNKCCLTFIDEAFNGTDPEVAQVLAETLIEALAKSPRTLCVTTTHFKRVTSLEKKYPHLCTNFKVNVKIDNNILYYPYILEKGISEHAKNIPLFILQKHGFDSDFIQEAKIKL